MKIIEDTADYMVIEREFLGTRQEFRVWKVNGKVEVRFTDEFARAHGYEGLTDMVIREGMTEWLADNGGVPEWLEWQNGDFMIKKKPLAN